MRRILGSFAVVIVPVAAAPAVATGEARSKEYTRAIAGFLDTYDVN